MNPSNGLALTASNGQASITAMPVYVGDNDITANVQSNLGQPPVENWVTFTLTGTSPTSAIPRPSSDNSVNLNKRTNTVSTTVK